MILPELSVAYSALVPIHGSVLSNCFVPASILKVILCKYHGTFVHNLYPKQNLIITVVQITKIYKFRGKRYWVITGVFFKAVHFTYQVMGNETTMTYWADVALQTGVLYTSKPVLPLTVIQVLLKLCKSFWSSLMYVPLNVFVWY